ncbi:MAG: MFS transporter [Acidisphaera sp.]|nr:MFS transporter [Acidisphaera sp.]
MTSLNAVAPDAAERASNRQIIVAAIASSLGWALDLFDLFLLLYVAPVIGRLFFPSDRPTLSLAAVYASFAVTLLMRPVGSALFGSYADRHGRKGAMIVAVVGVGISTALFGALPTIAQVGVIAPMIFLVLRLVQGVFVGGVVASTHTIGTESVPERWRGLMSGLVGGGGSGVGALLASLVFLIASAAFPGDAFATWGWRCMFFSGIFSSVLGLFVFNSLEESPLWARLKAARSGQAIPRAPLRDLFSRDYLPIFLVNLMMTIGGGAGYYLTSGYMPTFLKVVNRLPNQPTSLILIATSVVAIVVSPLIGHVSELIGRKKTFLILGLARLVLMPAGFIFMARAGDVTTITLYALGIAFLGNAGYAPLLIFLNERFPTALRSTGTGLSWNVGFAIGGMMPTFVSLLAGSTRGLPVSLAAFLLAISVLYLIGAIIIPETKGRLA